MILVSFFLEDNIPGTSIHISDGRGGGSKKNVKSRNVKLCAQSAQQNSKLCMFSSIFMLNLMVL